MRDETAPVPDFLTTAQASLRWSRSKEWFNRKRLIGDGPPFIQTCSGGRVLYNRIVVDEWFAARTVRSTSEVEVRDAAKATKLVEATQRPRGRARKVEVAEVAAG